jgi:hypothetical protein
MRHFVLALGLLGALIGASAISRAEAADRQPANETHQITFADLRTDQSAASPRIELARHRRHYHGYYGHHHHHGHYHGHSHYYRPHYHYYRPYHYHYYRPHYGYHYHYPYGSYYHYQSPGFYFQFGF